MAGQQQAARSITAGGKDYLGRTVDVLTLAFIGDPVYRWLLHDHSLPKQEVVLPKALRATFTACALNNGIFLEVEDFGSCGILVPPGEDIENPWTLIPAGLIPAFFTIGLGGLKRAIFEYGNATHGMMPQVLTKDEQKKHWYVFIMGTAVDRRRQGLATALLIEMQNRARSDGRPLWLEATTPISRDLYKNLGFTIVGEAVLGKGKVGPDGLSRKGGEGVTVWPMFWRPG